jgi:gluconolactonase
MRSLPFLAAAVLACAADYPYGPDSARQAGVPPGKVTQHTWSSSKLFPGTARDYWVYVPAQYKPGEAAAVMVFQDGAGYVKEDGHSRIPVVFDNLIAKGQMPVTIAIMINPGVTPALSPEAEARYNRSHEYDALGDRYARFLIEEILPEVGKSYTLTQDPNLRAISGSSSGGIAAFTAAWSRPDAFRRVLSFIGSYTNLRGGHVYASLVRKTEPKPLRVYLQDGRNDQNIYSGHWFIGNQDLASALEYARYDATFTIGEEGHNMKHGGPLMPDALRWLWRDWTQPIVASEGGSPRHYISQFLMPGKDWELLSSGHQFTEGPAVDKDGNVFFTDVPASKIHKISPDGKVALWKEDTGNSNGLMFGPDGRLYACQNGRKRIVSWAADGSGEKVHAAEVNSNDLVVLKNGAIYFTDPPAKKVWYVDPRMGAKRAVHEGFEFPNGVVVSPDQSLLMVADSRNKWVWSFQIQMDGGLAHGQPFYRLETPDETGQSSADGMTVDTEGHLYVATRLGLQVCDQPGRVVGIIGKPHAGSLSNAVFGGPGLDWIYATAGDRVYRRLVRRKGFFPWETIRPPKPGL